jgi:hypothetical protein
MNRAEQVIQIGIVEGLRYALPRGWKVHHSPNGGKRSKAEAAIFKAMGTEANRPDLELNGDLGDRPFTCFFEVKPPDAAVPKDQAKYHEELRALGFEVAVVRSWEDVLTACKQWRIPLRLAGYGEADVAA